MLLKIPIKINEFGSKKLFDALIACAVIQDSQRRKQLIHLLDKSISNNIGAIDSPNDTVSSILLAFSGFPNKIDQLLEAIKRLDSESSEYQKLHQVIFDIAMRQQDDLNDNKSILFEEITIDKNINNSQFDNLWSKLCLILDQINWECIWEACSKIETLIKKNDEVLIKSLCFTKNYKLLKKIFLDQYDSISIIIELCKLLKSDNKDNKEGERKKEWEIKTKNFPTFALAVNWFLRYTRRNPSPNFAHPNKEIELLLKNIQDIHESEKIRTKPDQNDQEDVFCFPPILLIIIERLGDGKDQDQWNVRGQLKIQGKIWEISLSKDKNGINCSKFEDIPTAIKSYIDYLETEPRFRDEAIDELRIEVFVPIFDLHCSLDNWAIVGEKKAISLVEKYRLFLRSRERVRKNSRIGLLRKGWHKLDIFLKKNCSPTQNTIAENIKDTPVSNIIELLEDTQISNWKEFEIFIKNSSTLWGIRLKFSLSMDKLERMNFFESIFNSGIPIAFWNWETIPSEVKFEQKFTECLCRDNLSKRCSGLLEKTWELRSILWGAKTEIERKQYPGYYLGMLLEDPEILPEENPLQVIGG